MTIKPGDTLPSGTLYHKTGSGIKPHSSDDTFRRTKEGRGSWVWSR